MTRFQDSDATPDAQRLAEYVEIWRAAVDDLLALLDSLDPADWSRDTDLPGWTVHDIVAHTAHLESVLATGVEEVADIGTPAHVSSPMGIYTEMGVVRRRDSDSAALINEIREASSTRYERLTLAPPTDPNGTPPIGFGGTQWTWERQLRNRPLDIWMHNQDIRRTVGRPGDLETPAARHTVDYLLEGLGMVLAKRVGAAPGTSVVVAVDGHDPAAFEVGPDGRGQRLDGPPSAPTLVVRTDRSGFATLAGGRGRPPADSLTIEGDTELGEHFLAAMAVTP